MRKIICTSLFLLGYILCLQAQDDEFAIPDAEPIQIPPSPTVSSLGSYGFQPVNLSTGQLNLNIPIWTIAGQDLSLPISMSYRPGVKIEETSPYTGHGWDLIAAGVITRSQVGLTDPYPRANLNTQIDYDLAEDYSTKIYDTNPDIFTYNFNGYTGRFILKEDFETIHYLGSQQDWKFSWNNDVIEIITSDGTKYIFAETETTTVDEPEDGSINIITSWHLSEIISAKSNEKIVFAYYNEIILPPYLKNNKLHINPFNRQTKYTPELGGPSSYSTLKVATINKYDNNKITSRVVFEANTPRNDLLSGSNGNALSRISIYNNGTGTVPIKYFDFDIQTIDNERLFLYAIQEFAGDGSSSKPPYQFSYKNEELLPKRLEYKADHWGYYSSLYGTEFPYDRRFKWRGDDRLTKEPSSSAVYGTLEKITYPTGAVNTFNYGLNQYHKKDWDYTSKSFALNYNEARGRWEDTTGASSHLQSYNFSINTEQYVQLDFCHKLKWLQGDILGLLDELDNAEIRIINLDNNQDYFYTRIETDGNDYDMLAYSNQRIVISPDVFENQAQDLIPNEPGVVYSDIIGAGNIAPYGYETSSYAYASYNPQIGSVIGDCLDRDIFVLLPTGNYQVMLKTASGNNVLGTGSSLSLNLTYHKGNRINKKVFAGGIRISNQYINGPDVEEQVIDYTYEIHDENGNGTGQSSGELMDRPMSTLLTPNQATFQGELNGVNRERHTIWSKPKDISNSFIVYTEVRESVSANDEDKEGFTLHQFHGIQNYPYNTSVFQIVRPATVGIAGPALNLPYNSRWPYPIPIERGGLLNKPKGKKIFKEKNGTFQLIQEEIFDYHFFPQEDIQSAYFDSYLTPENGQKVVAIINNHLTNELTSLKSKETIIYDQDGENPVSTKTSYDYLSGYYMPHKITTVDSQRDTRVKKLKYSYQYDDTDFTGNSTINIGDLLGAHMLVPIEEQLWELNNGIPKLLDGQLNIYDKVSATSNPNKLYQPIEVLRLETGSLAGQNTLTSEFNEIYYGDLNWVNGISGYDYGESGVDITYDKDGKTIQVTPKNGATISYIWGYDKQYPVAKIENATRSQIEALSGFGSDFDTGSGGLSSSKEATLRTHASMKNALITTYTYKPLIGITSMTDPRGYTMTYHYDALNRLEYVKDADGNLISENKYNYKNN